MATVYHPPTAYFEAGAPDACYANSGESAQRMSREDAELLSYKIEELKPTRAVIRDKHSMYAVRDAEDASRCVTWNGKRMSTVAAMFRGCFIHDAGYVSPYASETIEALPDRDTVPLSSPKGAAVAAIVDEKERERKDYIKALCALPEATGKPAAVAKLVDLYGNERAMPLWRASSILAGLPSEDPKARAKAERAEEATLIDAAKKRIGALAFAYDDAGLLERRQLAYSLRIKALEPKRPFVTCLRESGFTDIVKLRRAA